MELLLIRHARPEVVLGGTQAADPGLTDVGQAQAELLGKAIGDGLFGVVTRITTSPQCRAQETAEPLTRALGLDAHVDERLAELDYGWTTYGVAGDAYRSRPDYYRALNSGRWADDRFDPRDFTRRVTHGIEAVAVAHPDGVAAVVCHGGVISAYLSHVLGLREPFFVGPDYCSVTRVHAAPDGYREVLSFNENQHVRLT